MKNFGRKVERDGYKMDSLKEADFYSRFIKNCGKHYEVHPQYLLLSKFSVGGYNMRGLSYTPDFVIYDGSELVHVYDVKTSLSQRAIDSSAKIRFKLFAYKYGVPVEVVVPRANDFKMKFYGFTSPRIQEAHVKHDRHGKVKVNKNGQPTYDYYDIHSNVNYDIHDTIGM